MAALLVIGKNTKQLFKSQFFRKSLQIAHIADHERTLIGKREIVGYGFSGQPFYMDRPDFPFPAIRWKEPTVESEALREKERGDWNELSCEEKKALYRASFCQTYSEFLRSNEGEWKTAAGNVFFLMAAALWLYFFFKKTIYQCMGKPESFLEENRECQFRRILDLKMNPVRGISSKWDYSKDNWK